MKKLYVGCSIAYASPEFHQEIDQLKAALERDFEILNFIGLAEMPNETIFEHDLNCVKTADIFVANVTYPSLGLGYELATAVEAGKPVVAISKKGTKVSRFILGITRKNFQFLEYDDILDIVGEVVKYSK